MELGRRAHVLWGIGSAVGLLLSACEPATTAGPARAPTQADPFRDPAWRAGKPRVLVLMPTSSQTIEVWTSLSQELSADFDVVTRRVDGGTSTRFVGDAIATLQPACLVLMDNTTLRIYGQYQRQRRPGSQNPPAVVVMTSFLAEQAGALENAIGIAYEAPAVTQFSRLRMLINRRIRRVGVVFRPSLEPFVRRQAALARAENIEIVARRVAAAPHVNEVRHALSELIDTPRVDALWVLNDNMLLTPELVTTAWLPALGSARPLPVVVGVRSLIRTSPPLGTFAMIPDHESLGVQAASLVFELSEQHFQATSWRVDEPVSLKTIINGAQARSHFGFNDTQRSNVDEVVEDL